jgi:hypothetical protein
VSEKHPPQPPEPRPHIPRVTWKHSPTFTAISPATSPVSLDYPGIEDGIRGMAFIEAVVASSQANARWTLLQG